MSFKGSFRVPQLDYYKRSEIRNLAKVTRGLISYFYYRALQDYIVDVAKRVPVLTGATRMAVLEVLEEVESILSSTASVYGLPAEKIDVSMEPTVRQKTGSAYYPSTPDTTSPYIGSYDFQHYKNIRSREQWRTEALKYTIAKSTSTFTANLDTAWLLSFNFKISAEDEGFDYWEFGEPSDYEPEEAAKLIFIIHFVRNFKMFIQPALNILVGKKGVKMAANAGTQSLFDLGETK